jgi:signal transduction histidine kinase
MKLRQRIRFFTFSILIIPLLAILVALTMFAILRHFEWIDSEGLSAPRYLHTELLQALQGTEISENRFATIKLVLDKTGNPIYISHEANVNSVELGNTQSIFADWISKAATSDPIQQVIYTYNGSLGLVFYSSNLFTGKKIVKSTLFFIFVFYFFFIILPVLMMAINGRPFIHIFLNLEQAIQAIGKGDLDTPIKLLPRKHFKKHREPNEIESLVTALETMRTELKENYENQSRIMMAISHDLKTPLTLIKGYDEALKDGMATTPEDVQKYADIIYDRSMLLEERINDLIYFAKLRTSDWKSRFIRFSFSELINEFIAICKNDSLIRKRKFIYKSNLDKNAIILGDDKLLFQVFENLFDNACRYTDEHDTILLTIQQTNNNLMLSFQDSGSGISKEHQAHIFDSFYRADSGRNTRGIGIGLTSAKTIIENHEGTITYKDSNLGGACFVVTLQLS